MSTGPLELGEVAAQLGLTAGQWDHHGPHRAKVHLDATTGGPPGRYVLVTGMTPTSAGEGKTVTSIGLAMGLRARGHRAAVALRQSALGPTLGSKGGGAGGGQARLEPLAEALLGLTADTVAVEAANNLLAARVDDVLSRPAGLDVDPATVTWRRVLDMDDRALRAVTVHPDGRRSGDGRETGFDITAASEVMAVLALARDLGDLRRRLARIVVGLDRGGRSVTAEQLGAAGAMAVLLRQALQPNLLQTADGTPALVHAGPFANIAHGCSSVVADRLALPRVDYLVTEAGFGADLGAEKFLHLKCPASGHTPDVAVLVVTVRALADHGARLGATGPRTALVAAGAENLHHHVGLLRAFGLPVVVALNRLGDETPDEETEVAAAAAAAGAHATAAHSAYADGAAGATALAEAVEDAARLGAHVAPLVDPTAPLVTKVEGIARIAYRAGAVRWQPEALVALERLEATGFGHLPVCVAKTHLSLSQDPQLAGAPAGHELVVRDLRLAAGAGFVTVLTGAILTMPGLPAHPRFLELDLDDQGRVHGLV